MDIIDETVLKIKNLEIQGATNIVKVSLTALKTWVSQNPNITVDDFNAKAKSLATARPTEPFVQNVLNSVIQTIKSSGMQNAVAKISAMEEKLETIKIQIIENGAEELKNKNIILTHCHSSNVEEIIKQIFIINKLLKVFATKTEPLHQGEITAKNLAAFGINVTLVTDSEAAFLVSKEDNQEVNAVLIGADALLVDGSIINKVGSYGIALSAYNAGIPLYIVASLLKYAPGGIKIEERSPDEVWPNPPGNISILNPAFDKVPAKYITGIITEAGLIEPKNLSQKAQELYPEIFGGDISN